jgi:hypothetical protein
MHILLERTVPVLDVDGSSFRRVFAAMLRPHGVQIDDQPEQPMPTGSVECLRLCQELLGAFKDKATAAKTNATGDTDCLAAQLQALQTIARESKKVSFGGDVQTQLDDVTGPAIRTLEHDLETIRKRLSQLENVAEHVENGLRYITKEMPGAQQASDAAKRKRREEADIEVTEKRRKLEMAKAVLDEAEERRRALQLDLEV